MHRTQILLEDAQYLKLKVLSEETGRSIGELVREAVDKQIRPTNVGLRKALRESAGAWADRDDIIDGASYVESIRRGLTDRLEDLGWSE